MKCMKCQKETDKGKLKTIKLSSGFFYLCPECYHKWEKIYNKFKRTGKTGYWELGWKEFMELQVYFNPSYRNLHIEGVKS